jgi:hypothetical protein
MNPAMPPPPPPVSVLELSIECCNLKDKDILSKSDPMVSVYERRRGTSDQFNLIGETELIQNNLNPKFTTPIKVDFFFEELQELLFKVRIYHIQLSSAILPAAFGLFLLDLFSACLPCART